MSVRQIQSFLQEHLHHFKITTSSSGPLLLRSSIKPSRRAISTNPLASAAPMSLIPPLPGLCRREMSPAVIGEPPEDHYLRLKVSRSPKKLWP
ncbi:hypothetical protein RRG08_035028 [Elysia crispata]|uniref:Uncharacterized protein n=1 Tax=Elysia crispata TaxID=231223 RepID=A0AAE1DKZ1_9GAST|nr:hypothetical protein RRG08_035028 [Elysia crispata]